LAGLPHEVGGELLAGCRAACRSHPENEQIRLDVAEHLEKTPQVIPDLVRRLTLPDRPTAVFASSDFRAAAVFEAARRAGLRIPQDLAVVGYYNTPWCHMLPVPLTSVDLRVDELARRAVAALNETTRNSTEVGPVQPALIERASSPPFAPGSAAKETQE
jgi:DNA-binding LacI/PurR family transcriptional regulator